MSRLLSTGTCVTLVPDLGDVLAMSAFRQPSSELESR